MRGYSGKTMLAAEKGFYWRIELQYPLGQTGRVLYARMENFDAEKHLFPESSTYMDFLMKKKTKQP
ncbi:hypothetical protein FHX59_004909 [Paraburkholderia silvatlantica]|uniref:Uncharacterized protein n=1 Tax=Paraburkholderia silvatlantica TaxID=321895 RepID=A0ABR6FST4_9BURK|nr:hypothetical protein [Paraburkholderia silvatlantica]